MLKWTMKSAEFVVQGLKSADFRVRFEIVE